MRGELTAARASIDRLAKQLALLSRDQEVCEGSVFSEGSRAAAAAMVTTACALTVNSHALLHATATATTQ